MMLPRNAFLSAIALSWLLLDFDPMVSAQRVANKLASDFCSQRRTADDRKFCLQILTSDPQSASAEDHPSLLKIAINAAEANAERTLDYLKSQYKSKVTNEDLKAVLKDCIRMYGIVLNEFKGILSSIGVDSQLVKLYARVANDEIIGCENLLKIKKIVDASISNRNKIAENFGVLVEELARLV